MSLPSTLRSLAEGKNLKAEQAIHALAKVHPVSSFYVLLGELQLKRNDVEAALTTFQTATQQHALMQDSHFYARKGIVGASLKLGVIQGKDRKKNLATFVAAARKIPTDKIDNTSFCRALTIGGLQANDLAIARRFGLRWIEVSGSRREDAVWHMIIVEQRAGNHLVVIKYCDELLAMKHDLPKGFSPQGAKNAAIDAIQKAVGDLSAKVPDPVDTKADTNASND